MRSRTATSRRERLAKQALKLKKAWLLEVAWVGTEVFEERLTDQTLRIPEYRSWECQELQEHVSELFEDFVSILQHITPAQKHAQQQRAAGWMAAQFDRWRASRRPNFTMCTAQKFETDVGPLTARETLDIPPYTELLLQGWTGLAFRHPEYMLSRDLQLLCNLSRDAEELLLGVDWNCAPNWAGFGSENAQALNRATIQTCFNLLESFTSGLARAFVMEHPGMHDNLKKKLLDNSKPLRTRVVSVPQLITGKPCELDVNKPPISALFGPIKQRRDAFVHCEPGLEECHRGYVKQSAFHDVPWDLVREAVDLTLQIIQRVWNSLHGKARPTWLPEPGEDGRFRKENLRLIPSEKSTSR